MKDEGSTVTDDFKPGLEGVIAFESEIAEPDKEGSALRYRGVDIEDLVDRVSFGNVWGLLVDDEFNPGLAPAEPLLLPIHSGDVRVDIQSAIAMLAPVWDLKPLLDISDEEARNNLARIVLLKDVSRHGFTFFTHYSSRKGKAIHSQPHVALLFPWHAMERQVIVNGDAQQIPRSESEEYFATRPWASQISAWASRQSAPLGSREELEERWKSAASKWPEGRTVPTPPEWGGYRVIPASIEFWQGGYSRLHDRLRYERSITEEGGEFKWEIARYYP